MLIKLTNTWTLELKEFHKTLNIYEKFPNLCICVRYSGKSIQYFPSLYLKGLWFYKHFKNYYI